jgi:hypothetical protein
MTLAFWVEKIGADGRAVMVLDHENLARVRLRMKALERQAARMAPINWGCPMFPIIFESRLPTVRGTNQFARSCEAIRSWLGATQTHYVRKRKARTTNPGRGMKGG